MTVTLINLADIHVDDRQRKFFDEQQLKELSDSIKQHGLMHPILLRTDTEGKLCLVAGERRYRAISAFTHSYSFGDTTVEPGQIPALCKEMTAEIDWIEAELAENTQRADLTWQEQTAAIQRIYLLQESRRVSDPKAATVQVVHDHAKSDWHEPTSHTKARVQDALFLSDFMNVPEVQKAKSRREAIRIATTIAEQELAQKLIDKKRLHRSKQETSGKTTDVVITDEADTSQVESSASKMTLASLGFVKSISDDFKLIHGDCLEELPKLHAEEQQFNVILTDPPYGINSQNFNEKTGKHKYDDDDDAFAVVLNSIPLLTRVAGPHAHLYMFCDFTKFEQLSIELVLNNWEVRRTPIIWDKGTLGALSSGKSAGWSRVSEYILHAWRGNRMYKKVLPDIIKAKPVSEKIHGAQKPVELLQQLLDMSALGGDKVLDPFAGSGSIFAAAKDRGLAVYGIELLEEYVNLAETHL